MAQIAQKAADGLHTFLRENFLAARPGLILGDDDQLLDSGIIDSMGVLELLAFIEETHGIRIDDHEVNAENLGSVRAIASLIAAKCAN